MSVDSGPLETSTPSSTTDRFIEWVNSEPGMIITVRIILALLGTSRPQPTILNDAVCTSVPYHQFLWHIELSRTVAASLVLAPSHGSRQAHAVPTKANVVSP
jgi:hypothetical protein